MKTLSGSWWIDSERPRSVWKRLLGACVAALMAVVGLAGCDDKAPSLLEGPRVLAIRGEPAALVEGTDITLEVIGFELGEVTWDACPAPFSPGLPATCPIEAIPIGSGNPVTVPVPDGLMDVWVRATVEGAVPAIRSFSVGGPAANPELIGLQTDEGEALSTVSLGGTQAIQAELAGEASGDPEERRYVTFYSTAGRFMPFRRFEEEASDLEIAEDDELGDVTIIAIVRDADGGVGFATDVIEVVP